ADEALGVRRLDDLHLMPHPHEHANEVARLVRRDPTADADEDHGRSVAASRPAAQPPQGGCGEGARVVVGIAGWWSLGQLTFAGCANWFVPHEPTRAPIGAGRLPMRRVRPQTVGGSHAECRNPARTRHISLHTRTPSTGTLVPCPSPSTPCARSAPTAPADVPSPSR